MRIDKPDVDTSLNVVGPISGTSFVKIGATSADFLKGDGSTSTGTLTDNGGGQVTLTIAGATTLATLTDATITSNTSGEILKWNGSAWINNTLAEASISSTSHN